MTNQTATLNNPPARAALKGASVGNNRKEKGFYKQLTLVVVEPRQLASDKPLRELATVRLYSTNSRNYACVWIGDSKNNVYLSAGAFAGGYGYHRESAAMSYALDYCGVTLSQDIGGRGDQSMTGALIAIGEALGYHADNLTVLEAHA